MTYRFSERKPQRLSFLLALPALTLALLLFNPTATIAAQEANMQLVAESVSDGPAQEREKKESKKERRAREKAAQEDGPILKDAEVAPEPPGGDLAFRRWIAESYNAPMELVKDKVSGIIEVSFVVNTDGSLSNFKVVKDLGYGSGNALIRLLKKSKPWKPGLQDGEKVRVQRTTPVTMNFYR